MNTLQNSNLPCLFYTKGFHLEPALMSSATVSVAAQRLPSPALRRFAWGVPAYFIAVILWGTLVRFGPAPGWHRKVLAYERMQCSSGLTAHTWDRADTTPGTLRLGGTDNDCSQDIVAFI
jgi:hypothetical protein